MQSPRPATCAQVNYKEVMKQYGLGPNGGAPPTHATWPPMRAGIVTSLNLFATRFDQVLELVAARANEHALLLLDTPGQIEVCGVYDITQ